MFSYVQRLHEYLKSTTDESDFSLLFCELSCCNFSLKPIICFTLGIWEFLMLGNCFSGLVKGIKMRKWGQGGIRV